MTSNKISQAEANRLLVMIKHSLTSEINFPLKGKTEEFNVVGDNKRDIFVINIYRGKINPFKYNIGARILKNGIVLLELHINPSNVHPNPDGQKIIGNHWHIYNEKYDRLWAFSAEDIESKNFVKNTIIFLDKFNVIDHLSINFQLELIS